MPYLFNEDLSRILLATAIAPYIANVKEDCWGWC